MDNQRNNYKRAKQFYDEHSPVKMKLKFNGKFKHYQLNSDESINRCNKVEVKFPLNPNMEVATGLNSAIESKEIDILAAKQLTVDNIPYSIKVKVLLGQEEIYNYNGRAVKEDIAVIDPTDHMPLKVWGEDNISCLVNNNSYIMTNLKICNSMIFGTHFTTSPHTVITSTSQL